MTPFLCAFALLASDTWILFQSEQHVTISGDLSLIAAVLKDGTAKEVR
jgi:hypothetical protein